MSWQFLLQLLQGHRAPKRDWLSENEATPRRWGQEKPPTDGSPEPQRMLWVGFHGCSWGSSSLLSLDSVEYSVWLDSEKGDCIGMAQEDGTCHTSLATKFDPWDPQQGGCRELSLQSFSGAPHSCFGGRHFAYWVSSQSQAVDFEAFQSSVLDSMSPSSSTCICELL